MSPAKSNPVKVINAWSFPDSNKTKKADMDGFCRAMRGILRSRRRFPHKEMVLLKRILFMFAF